MGRERERIKIREETEREKEHRGKNLEDMGLWSWRDGSAAKSTSYSCRGPCFHSQHRCRVALLPAPGNPTPSPNLCEYTYTYRDTDK